MSNEANGASHFEKETSPFSEEEPVFGALTRDHRKPENSQTPGAEHSTPGLTLFLDTGSSVDMALAKDKEDKRESGSTTEPSSEESNKDQIKSNIQDRSVQSNTSASVAEHQNDIRKDADNEPSESQRQNGHLQGKSYADAAKTDHTATGSEVSNTTAELSIYSSFALA